jgi:hypothetical protein
LSSPFYQKFLKVTLKVEEDYKKLKVMIMTSNSIDYNKKRFSLSKNIVNVTKDIYLNAFFKVPLKKLEIVYTNIKKPKGRRYPKLQLKKYLRY